MLFPDRGRYNKNDLLLVSGILKKQGCLRVCSLDFSNNYTELVNHLYENLLDNLPEEIEMLSLSFKNAKRLSDSGFECIVKGLARYKE